MSPGKLWRMMITVEIPDDVLLMAMRIAGRHSAQEAILAALKAYVGRGDQRSLIPLLGTFDDFMTVEELNQMREDD